MEVGSTEAGRCAGLWCGAFPRLVAVCVDPAGTRMRRGPASRVSAQSAPPEVRDLLWDRADSVIWLDYPRRVVMPRVLRRSFRRTVTREVLFGGNRETWAGWLSREHPAWWAWSQHAARRREIERRTRDLRFAPLVTVRFGHPDDTAAWAASL